MRTEPVTVSVVTPTIGRPHLKRAIESVRRCAHACPTDRVEHVLVVDGPEALERVRAVVEAAGPDDERYSTTVLPLPYATQRSGAVCRAIGSVLARGEYVAFLDDDNWYAPTHLADCLQVMRSDPSLAWMHTARWIVRASEDDGVDTTQDAFEDKSESLGLALPVWSSFLHHMVDTNCYFLSQRVCKEMAPWWHVAPIAMNWGEDRVFFARTVRRFRRHAFLAKPTVFYVASEVVYDYITRGNARRRERIQAYWGRTHTPRLTYWFDTKVLAMRTYRWLRRRAGVAPRPVG